MPKVKSILVQVSERDIKRGKPHSTLNCPMALALKRATRKTWYVLDNEATYNEVHIKLPTPAKTFIRRFDSGKVVKPFTFKLLCPK